MRAEAAGCQRGARIVVVDDSETILDVLRALLEEEGYDVLTCGAWDDPYACIKQARPRLLILDVRVRGRPDWAVYEQVRADPELAELPCIICSAALDQLEQRRAELMAQGCQILAKPFDLDELLACVCRGLGPGPGHPEAASG